MKYRSTARRSLPRSVLLGGVRLTTAGAVHHDESVAARGAYRKEPGEAGLQAAVSTLAVLSAARGALELLPRWRSCRAILIFTCEVGLTVELWLGCGLL